MRTENEVRQMLAILRAFNTDKNHEAEITALSWVLNEYPLMSEAEAAIAAAPE